MPNVLSLLPVAFSQAFLSQRLSRTPEKAVMDDQSNVHDFDRVMETNVSISLFGMVDLIGRIGYEATSGRAVDLACGPGHFTILLAKYFDFDEVIGIDLSGEMLERAVANAKKAGVEDRVTFVRGDVTKLQGYEDNLADLVTCTNSIHHLPDLDCVEKMLAEMDRIVCPKGLCATMDLTRLKSDWSVSRYVREMGREYAEMGLTSLFSDFRNSMHAAWTTQELMSVLPETQDRHWSHFALRPIPINQFAFSTAPGRSGLNAPKFTFPLVSRLQSDYELYHASKCRELRKVFNEKKRLA